MAEILDLSMFKKSDQEKAAENLNKFEQSLMPALESTLTADFAEVATQLRNAANYMDNLSVLRNAKVQWDKSVHELNENSKETIRRHYF